MTMLLYFFILLVGGESVENRLHFPPLPPTSLRVGEWEKEGGQNRARKGKNGSTFLRVIFVFPFFFYLASHESTSSTRKETERKRRERCPIIKVSASLGDSVVFFQRNQGWGEGVDNKTSIDNGQAASSSPKPGGGKKTQRFTSHLTPNWECPQHRK